MKLVVFARVKRQLVELSVAVVSIQMNDVKTVMGKQKTERKKLEMKTKKFHVSAHVDQT